MVKQDAAEDQQMGENLRQWAGGNFRKPGADSVADALNQMTRVFKQNRSILAKKRALKLQVKELKKENGLLS